MDEIKFASGLREKLDMPEEVLDVVRRATAYMKEHLTPKEFKDVTSPPNYFFYFEDYERYKNEDWAPKSGEWRLGSNFEDGIPTAIFNMDSRKWFYRDPRSGTDSLVKGGAAEVVYHLAAMFIDI